MSILMQDASKKEKKPDHLPGAKKSESPSPDTIKVSDALKSTPSVLKYGLYDAGDEQIRIENSPFDPFGPIEPSKIFSTLENSPNSSENGNSYLLLHTASGIQMILFKFKDIRVIVALKLGHPPHEFLKSMHSIQSIQNTSHA